VHRIQRSFILQLLDNPQVRQYFCLEHQFNTIVINGMNGPEILRTNSLKPLKAELNPICHLLVLLGAHHILHVSRIRVNRTYIKLKNFKKRNVKSNILRLTYIWLNSKSGSTDAWRTGRAHFLQQCRMINRKRDRPEQPRLKPLLPH
jgi:hypothetical protein